MTLRKLKRFVRLSACSGVLLSCLCCGVNAQVTLYDNLNARRDSDPEAGRWRAWATQTSEWIVQPFLTGDADNVSSVTIDFQPKGNPAGELAIEIWDDNGSGKPRNVLGRVGSLDLASLDGEGIRGGRGGEWEFITFDKPVVGLSPDSKYYVVLNYTDTDVDTNNWVANGFTRNRTGAFGAGLSLAGPEEGWATLSSIFNSFNFSYLDMAVTAEATFVPEPADLNMDGFVDGLDLGILLGNFVQNGISASGGELNGTDPVDGLDLGILLNAWKPERLSPVATVPEPSTMMMLSGLAAIGLFARRGRRVV